jgi:predicted MFS family arabinose efflux permease
LRTLERLALWAIPALRRAPYGLAAALLLVRFADEWTTFLPAGALEAIRHDLTLSYAEVATILVALPAGGILGNVFLVAADHMSRRVLASAGALAYGAALITIGLAHSLPLILVAAFLWGAASDAFVHGAEVALVDLAGEDLPKALARMHGWAAVGDLLGPVTLGVTAAVGLGWRGAFIGLGVAMLGYAAWMASLKLPPPHPTPDGEARQPLKAVFAVMRDPRVVALSVVMGLFALLDEPLQGFMIAYWEKARAMSPAAANAPIVAELLGAMAGYAAFDRFAVIAPGRRVLASAVLMTLALPAAIFAPWLAAQILAAAAFGLAGALFYTTLDAQVLGLRPGQAGAVSAVVSTIGMIGMGFPALVGFVADTHGLAAGVGLYAILPLVILALLALRR